MKSSDYPPPNYEEASGNSSFSGAPATARTMGLTDGSFHGAPFRVSLISSTSPVFGQNPIETDCPFCQAHIVTSTERQAGVLPRIMMLVCFLLGFFLIFPWCLCCVPFCTDCCLDVIHSCPSCKRVLGRFSRV
ncbi:unnamed protein product [Gongylonema pulchrum]|uniref:LITAF domain-containing protein n=1 Tax=Gongylonema pulchrum TaxID=637853 RepID=A0A183E5C0_9BILA|nr:unnamed protein product [Gongylonema pulchrum]